MQGLQVPALQTPVLQAVPLLTNAQVPVEQVWHSPQGVEQQVPPTQLLLRHWLLAPEVQLWLSSYFGVQVPPEQKLPIIQSLSLVQAPVLQAVVEAQTNSPGHALAVPATQVWLLLHVLLVSIEELQDGVPQSDPPAA